MQHNLSHFLVTHAAHWWRKSLIVLLLGISAFELYEAIKFFFFEYPELERSMAEHLLSSAEIQQLTAGAFAESAVSALNIFFAVRLFKVQEKLLQIFDLVSSSGLVVWHQRVIEWLSHFNYVAIWERFF